MKKFLLSAMLASSSAFAAGPYDGVYQSASNSSLYLSVHQNGSALIVAAFVTVPAFNVDYTSSGGTFRPQRADIWDLYSGTIGGNVAATQGENTFGACLETGTFTFDGGGVTYRLSATVQTAAGRSQGYSCSAATGSQLRFNRVF